MNIETYIHSGIIESYVLGLATHDEVAELEALGFKYPEIRKAVAEFSASLEREALEHKIIPPPEVKQKVLDIINREKKNKVVSITDHTTTNAISLWRMAAVACVILFIFSAGLNFYLYNQYRSKSDDYQSLLGERSILFADNQVYQTSLQQWRSAAEMMADSFMLKITLGAMPGKQHSMATLFWDTRNKDVYVMANHLPSPDAGKQYQLWAIVNGKPVAAGMITNGCEGACKISAVSKAEAFAISLEKQGGSISPTSNAIYVLGKTNS